MNTHENKNRIAKPLAQNRALLERDHMPVEVATDLLCTARHLTNRQRKTYMAARARVYISTLEPLLIAERMAKRLQGVAWEQLLKWNRRMIQRGAQAQALINILQRRKTKLGDFDPDKEPHKAVAAAALDRMIAGQNMRGSAFQSAQDAIETEIERRQKFWNALKKVAPSIAKKIENK